jgi:hypothetical protein
MLRASSAVRFQGVDNGNGLKGKGMGDRSVSLPSLVPGKGYPGGNGDKPMQRKTPSELLVERRDFGVLQTALVQKPQITGFLDITQYSNNAASVVPVDQPLFSVHPPVVTFSNFEGLQTYEATITLRNTDNVARRVKVYPPNSPFFDLAAGRGVAGRKKASGSGPGDKVAPGMEVTYVIRFKPDARIDYSHDLVVITEREKFSVPIRASGGSALLDFPDSIDFGRDCVVGHQSERTVLVRNIGDRATKFVLRTNPPFSIANPDGYLPEGETCQVDILFKPERADAFEQELHLRYGELEAVAMLYGAAANAEVSLSHSLLVIEDTYVGLETQGVVIIRNNSDVPVDFSWRLFPAVEEEEDYRLQLHGQLQHEEREEMLFMMQADNQEDESSDESGSDEERLKDRQKAKIHSTLGRKYGNIKKAVTEDPMLFHDATFSIEPLVGRVWSHSQLMCACSFRPKDALVYSSCAYLSCVGQEERAPLVLKGLGIGPKASFSYDELDVNSVFVESAHRYEVQLLNQGDIEVAFQLVPRDTKFGSRFQFDPHEGTIPVGGQCEITVNFKPTELGDFHEVFDWKLAGSAIGVTLAFKGRSIQPSFDFDVERINFGIVSYGFLNSRMLTLSNTAEVPMRYTLRIIGDENANEFDIVPGSGTLLPNCSQRVQVDFISCNEKRYDLCLAVDLEGVGKELKTIPVTATCAAPQVTFEPHGCLSYGDVFIRYPFHQSLYLHNTSNLPAKFEVMPQEDKSRAEFEPDQWTGSVPPCASHVITVTLTAHMPGPVRVPMYVRIPGRAVPFPLVLVANSIGPRVIVDPPMLDWGPAKCLENVTRHVRLTNNSCIDASVRAFMNERKSLWSVHPKIIHLSPQECLQLAVTLNIDEATTAQDTLNLIVCESNPLTVQVKAKGVETPVYSEELSQCNEIIDFETLFTTHQEPREIVIKNMGQFSRRISWVRESAKGEKKDKKNEAIEKPPPIFRVDPENIIMEPKTAYRFTFWAMSPNPGYVEEVLVCNETLDKGGGPGKPIFRPKLMASFVAPQLKLSTSELRFEFYWSRDKPVAPMEKTLTLENTGPLEVAFNVQIAHPFSVEPMAGSIAPHSTLELTVEFDPRYKTDRKSGTVKKELVVQYDDHPAVNKVDLIGKVVWPNLEMEQSSVQFGIILNETSKSHEVELKNPTPLTVSYNWCLQSANTRNDDAASRTTPGSTQVSAWARTTAQTDASATSGVKWDDDADGGVSIGPGSTIAGFDAAGPDSDVNQIFDILPIFGQIPPNSSVTAHVTYYGQRDRTCKARAVCMVEGGPEYELDLKGSAAPCKYSLDKYDLDFGDIPFTELGEAVLSLKNEGKVPASFNFNSLGMSRSNVVEVFPKEGIIEPAKNQKIAVRFRAGIPDMVNETVLVEVAHFEPSKLTVKGNGTFPGIVIGLPRQNQEEHRMALANSKMRMTSRLDQQKTAILDAESSSQVEATMGASADGSVFGTAPSVVGIPTSAAVAEANLADQDPVSPRSAASEDLQSVATRKTVGARPTQEDLDLELEVDRHNLCEALLQKSPESKDARNNEAMNSTQRMTMRSSPTASRTMGMRSTRGKEAPSVTAAWYSCDFGHIALGQTGKRQLGIYNCCTEPVFITIDRRKLREAGFLVEPENVSKLPARQMTYVTVSATRPREEEGLAELKWDLPVRGGPNYEIYLQADFVLPDLVISTPTGSESLDFGRILVGQRKRITIELKNEKKVPVEWAYIEPKTSRSTMRGGKSENIFELNPPNGVLMPDQTCFVVASFTPRAQQQYNSTLQLRLRDNQKRKAIHVTGRGDMLRLDVKPELHYELGPVMPNRGGHTREFKICNMADYPIEVYSVDFDNAYLEEEKILKEFAREAGGFAEVKVRQPGDGTWQHVVDRAEQLQKKKERDEAQERGEEVPEEEEEESAPAAVEEEEDDMNAADHPHRVPNGSRLNALIFGPPKSGISTVARKLATEDRRRALHIDEVFEWAKNEPRFLHHDWKARKIIEAINGRPGFPARPANASEAAHLLKRRVELPDCNAGVIIDGIISKHMSAGEVAEAALEAFGSETFVVVGLCMPPPADIPVGKVNPDASVSVMAEGEENRPHPYAAAAEVLRVHYETLSPAVAQYATELKAKIQDLENAHKAAADAVEAAAAVADAGEDAGEDGDAQADPEVLKLELHSAKLALENAKFELEQCEEFAGWTPEKSAEMFAQVPQAVVDGSAPPPPVPPPSLVIAEGYAKQFEQVGEAVKRYNMHAMQEEESRLRHIDRSRRAKKAAAKEAAKPRGRTTKTEPMEIGTPPGPPPGMEDWAATVHTSVYDFKALQKAVVEVDGAEVCHEGGTALLFHVLPEAVRNVVPLPMIPAEKPLPASTVMQVIEAPADRKERDPIPNFSILTPVPPNPEQLAEYEVKLKEYEDAVAAAEPHAANPTPEPKAKAKAAPAPVAPAAEDKPEPPQEVDLTDKTRWIIDPLAEQRLKVHFSADEVANYSTTLQFEVVGDNTAGSVAINVAGISALPGIASDPRIVFPKCKKRRPQEGVCAVKAFVTSFKNEDGTLGIYDFGPLLAGRDVNCRHPTPIKIEEEPDADPDVTLKLAEPGTEVEGSEPQELEQLFQPVSSNVMRHSVDLRISNDSLFPANVKFTLASNPEGDPASPGTDGSVPYVIEPSSLLLPTGESQNIKLWCFPSDKGMFEDSLVATIEHNPDPVTFKLCAIGSIPSASLDVDNVHFGRWMEKIRADDQFVKLKNESALPVRWQLICRESQVIDADPHAANDGQGAGAKAAALPGDDNGEAALPQVPEEFSLDTTSGTLAAGEERNLRIGFRALKAATYHFALGLEVQDAENFRDWEEKGRIDIKAETFAVKVEVEPDPRENILNFETVLVGESKEKEFAVVNKGLYPVRYVLRTRGRALNELLTVEPTEGELPPGESRKISVKCMPVKLFDAANDRDGIVLQIFDIQSGEQVDHKIPHMRVGVSAVYNSFQITPPRGLNFGPVEKDETRNMSFCLRNTGIFGFDWCLFDPLNPPTYKENGPPKIEESQVAVGPFTIKPTSGKLQKDEQIEFDVVFKAAGDQDYDCKLGLWVDGVQGELDVSTLRKGSAPSAALAALASPGSVVAPTSTYILTGQSCIPGINTTDLQTVFEEQFFARTLEDAIAIAGRPDVRVFCELDQIFNFGPVLAHGGSAGYNSQPASPAGKNSQDDDEATAGVVERFRLTNPKSIPCKVHMRSRSEAVIRHLLVAQKEKEHPPPLEMMMSSRSTTHRTSSLEHMILNRLRSPSSLHDLHLSLLSLLPQWKVAQIQAQTTWDLNSVAMERCPQCHCKVLHCSEMMAES